ncbi:MAG: phosphatidate cytidylyltransferase [Prevotellaceae bacterium]|nr:phosphatidate cytidylyltransferase [Prevotellaceae bacterium]
MGPKLKNFIVRAISGVLFVAIMIAGFMRFDAMLFLFTLITGMAIWEFTGLVNDRAGVTVNRFICSAAGVFLNIAMAGFCSGLTPAIVFIPYLITIIYLFVSELYLKQEDPIHDWAYAMMSQLYIALPFSCINILAFTSGEFYWLMPLSIFVFLWCNDTGAYLSGSLFGKHKLFPRVSPGKSWEGSIGGGILVVAVAALVGYLEPTTAEGFGRSGMNILEWMGLGLVVVFFGTWGDLVESLFKRTLGIKDSGNVLPGHGGMLDRFDSSLMAIPASVIYIYTISFI